MLLTQSISLEILKTKTVRDVIKWYTIKENNLQVGNPVKANLLANFDDFVASTAAR